MTSSNPPTFRKTTTRIIGKGTIVVARKKRNKPAQPRKIQDPAEAARIASETRANPGRWGPNDEALRLAQNESVKVEAETRTKTARIYRYDAFGILYHRGALADNDTEGHARLQGVRRFEEALAQRMRLEGTQGAGVGGGRQIPISDRSLSAATMIEAVERAMTPMLFGLLVKLVSPSVERGQPVSNWRGVVEDHTGEHRHVHQASHVRACAADLLDAWQTFDNRERRAA